ncbi:hypothetical protein SAMN06265367_11065 [Algoriphagus winogradskyi]|uniref:Uncharacterized protein n=1 Tax=Algoriphagus winogradskyi TaxID=237017 RepID=A0ABY1PI72_9BACT|nr:hypothetical protein SAMN06265367_11065 [Algoriphagus winogradskyi]
MKLFYLPLIFMFTFSVSAALAQENMPPHIKEGITYRVMNFHLGWE